MIDVRHAGAGRFFADDVARLALGADKKNGTAVSHQTAHVQHRLVVFIKRFFKVDDVDFVAMAKNIIGHFRVPVTGLVTKMDARFQHLSHSDRHNFSIDQGLTATDILV